jgi:ribosomal protein S18 acetylase RimI-like enzyme
VTVPFSIRAAMPADVPALRGLIGELAAFEQLTHLVRCTDDDLHAALFGQSRAAEAVVLQPGGEPAPVAFALYFHNFSTFLGRRGLYLEDLYVRESHRRRGYGRALLVHLARIAGERGCGRFEWSVLDWNVEAQRFYEGLGATILPDWRIVRVTGEALRNMAALEG